MNLIAPAYPAYSGYPTNAHAAPACGANGYPFAQAGLPLPFQPLPVPGGGAPFLLNQLPGFCPQPLRGPMYGLPPNPPHMQRPPLPAAAQQARHALHQARTEFSNGVDNASQRYGDRVSLTEIQNEQGLTLGVVLSAISDDARRNRGVRPTLLVAASRAAPTKPAIWTDVPVNYQRIPPTPHGMLDLAHQLRRGKQARPAPYSAAGEAGLTPDLRISSQALGPEDAAGILARREWRPGSGPGLHIFAAAPGMHASLSDVLRDREWGGYGRIVYAG